jgi:hypothetical protein
MQEQDGLTPDGLPPEGLNPHGLSPGARELELAMKSLSPAAARIDGIAAAFAAGRRSGERPMRVWRAAAVLMLLVGAGSWLMPARHNAAVPSQEFSPAIAIEPSPAAPLAAESLQVLQQTVREKGLDGLPAENIPAVHVINAEDIF